MQHPNHHQQSQRLFSRSHWLPVLLGATAMLAALAIGGIWSQAHAAPQSGAPLLSIISIDGNTLTLQFDGWEMNEIITLSYSRNANCIPTVSLPNNTFSAENSSFTANYDWPTSGIPAGTYHLCATGSISSGPFASQETITVDANGMIQSTPGPGTPQPTNTSGPGTPSATTSPGASPGASMTPGSTSAGKPGTGGASESTSGSFSSGALAAIILLCVLVLGLLAYLVRIWLQGRRPSGGTP
jgi:hypothetical protein